MHMYSKQLTRIAIIMLMYIYYFSLDDGQQSLCVRFQSISLTLYLIREREIETEYEME